ISILLFVAFENLKKLTLLVLAFSLNRTKKANTLVLLFFVLVYLPVFFVFVFTKKWIFAIKL
ncbi:hypothetical protein, partial [Mesomycoplasma ovipneumoniae]|uniref:hypothetical protein n=1 Tax=Mesomycoplasma ovipneumoniae TaxID=29562 RepID=UPI0030806925